MNCVGALKCGVKVLSYLAFVPLIMLLLSSGSHHFHSDVTARNVKVISDLKVSDHDIVVRSVDSALNASEDKSLRPCSQPERLQAIQQYCERHPELATFTKHPMSKLDKYHVFLVDERHKILFCAVPKAAVTLWRTMFLHGTGKVDETREKLKPYHGPYLNKMGLKFLYNYTEPQQQQILSTYFKIMSVRHPVERALSSYMDKFVYSELEFPILDAIDYINQNYREADDQIRLSRGRQTIPSGVEFPEFVRMVLDNKAPYNIHWDSIIHICHPCLIKYDYVMKTETMSEDAPYILDKLSSNLKNPLKLTKIHSHRNAVNEDPNDFTKTLPELKNITSNQLHAFVDNFQQDMDMFGYSYTYKNSEINCAFDNLGRGRCC